MIIEVGDRVTTGTCTSCGPLVVECVSMYTAFEVEQEQREE